MFDETKETQEPVNDGAGVAPEPVNPYLAKAPEVKPEEAQAANEAEQNVYRSAEQNVYQSAGQSVQQAEGMGTQQNSSQSWEQVMNSASVSVDSDKPKKKNGAVIAVVALAVVALILLIAVIAVFAFKSFGNKKQDVAEALSATFKESGEFMNEAWNSEEFEGMFEGNEITVEADMEMPDGIDVEMTMQQTEDASGFYILGSMEGIDILEIEGYADDELIAVSVPNLLDYVFHINRETLDEDIWNLVDIGLLDEETVELLIEANEGQQEVELSEEVTDEISKKMLSAWTEFYAKTDMEEGEDKELTYDGEDVDCKGYNLIVTYGDLADFFDEILNILEESDEAMAYLEVLLTAEDADADIEEEFEELRDEIEELREDAEETVVVEFYLYDGKVAQIYTENNDVEFEWNIEGGSFPLENTSIRIGEDGDEVEVIRAGEMHGDEYRAEYTIIDEYDDEMVFDIRYTKETGDIEFECLEYGYSLIFFAGNIEKTDDDTVTIDIDTIEVDEEELMSGEMIMIDGCDKIEVPEGEEVDLLNLSEDEWYDLVDELAMALMDILY